MEALPLNLIIEALNYSFGSFYLIFLTVSVKLVNKLLHGVPDIDPDSSIANIKCMGALFLKDY